MALESARAIVVKDGIFRLSGRKVTSRMGYTIGTLYQLFDSMDDLVERMNAETLSDLYDFCLEGAERDQVSEKLRAFGLLFTEFVNERPNEWDAVMTYQYRDGHKASEAYNTEIFRLFGLMKDATRHLYAEDDNARHSADMAVLWASLTGILGVARSERQVGGLSLDQMLDQLIRLYLDARS
ncbi:MAG: TetR/AcrR family transcriptional regulator [Paracoccaceae bacterium]|nr:TetR/AcrR family transcriptional regulator [Paracoccaceae bacterium]